MEVRGEDGCYYFFEGGYFFFGFFFSAALFDTFFVLAAFFLFKRKTFRISVFGGFFAVCAFAFCRFFIKYKQSCNGSDNY